MEKFIVTEDNITDTISNADEYLHDVEGHTARKSIQHINNLLAVVDYLLGISDEE